MSLNLRFGFIAIALLLTAVLAISYLFDIERTATIHDRERQYLRYHAERTSETLLHHLNRLRGDLKFLVQTPPIHALQDMLEKTPDMSLADRRLTIWYGRLEVLFHALAHTRPEYQRLRLIGYNPEASVLLSVARREDDFVIVDAGDLQPVGDDLNALNATFESGKITLLPIERKQDQKGHADSQTTILRAVAPIHTQTGKLIALIVINLDLDDVFRSMEEMVMHRSKLTVVDETGAFLMQPDIGAGTDSNPARPVSLSDQFPDIAGTLKDLNFGELYTFSLVDDSEGLSGVAIKHFLSLFNGKTRYLTLIITESDVIADRRINDARRTSYLKIIAMLAVMILLIIVVTRRLTRSLRDMVKVSHAVSQGNYEVEIPDALGRDMKQLSNSLKQMIATLKQRESQLLDLNQTLDMQVRERTRALEESRAQLGRERLLLQSILDHVGDGVVAIDSQGRTIQWNRHAQTILGSKPVNLPLESWPSHFGIQRAPDSGVLPADEFPLMRALDGEIVRHQELFISNGQNPPGRWISMFSRPFYGCSEVAEGAVAVLVDIEEHRHLQEQLDAQSGELAKIGRLTLIGQIIDNIAHRLSQPLAAIANYAGAAIQMQQSGSLDQEELKDILNLITQQTERAGVCLQDLRALRQRDSEVRSRVMMNPVIESAYRLLEDRLKRNTIQSELVLSPEAPGLIGKKVELQQAIVHLLLNAQESLATRDQPRLLKIVTTFIPETRHLEIAIGDNGPGVDPDAREQIFEAWYTTKPDSFGLGLSFARSIIEDHNGTLELRNRGDDLTWFVIDLPVERDDYER